MKALRIAIIEEQPLFCRGIRAVLEGLGGDILISESTKIADVEHACMTRSPHVAIIGDLCCADPLEIAHVMRRLVPSIALVLLTANQDEEHFFQAIKVGVAAYARRTTAEEELIEMVRKVSRGEYLLSDAVLSQPRRASRVGEPCREPPSEHERGSREHSSPLSGRERQILDFVAQGGSNKEIAKSLNISEQTVKNHMTGILKKLSVKDRTAAVMRGLQQGWIQLAREKKRE